MLHIALCALGISSALAHVVPGGDVDPDHDHGGIHGGEFPFHLHDPPGPHGHSHNGSSTGSGWELPEHDFEEISFDDIYNNLQTRSTMGSFTTNHGLSLLQSYVSNIVPLKQRIEEHADANHPRDGSYRRGEYDKNDPDDPTTIYIRTRFLHQILVSAPPLPPNPLENACRLARCMSAPNNENPNQSQCVVEGGMLGGPIPYATIECVCNTRPAGNGPFYHPDSTCNTCSEELGNDYCTQCAMQTYLYRGSCYDSCPDYSTAFGGGNFNRRCMEWSCVPNEGNCNACDADNILCEQCGNATYLHDGQCVHDCPAGTEPQGGGNFNRVCQPSSTGGNGGGSGGGSGGISPSCIPGVNNCHFCDSSGDFCTKCNRAFLYQGECIDSCPPGTEAKGATSNFNRRCVDL